MAKAKSLSDKIETIINNQKLSFKIKLAQLQTLQKKNLDDQFLGSVIDEISREAIKEAGAQEALGAKIAEKLRVQEANAADSHTAPAVKEKMSAETFINKFIYENPRGDKGEAPASRILLNDYLKKHIWILKMAADNPEFSYFCTAQLSEDPGFRGLKMELFLERQILQTMTLEQLERNPYINQVLQVMKQNDYQYGKLHEAPPQYKTEQEETALNIELQQSNQPSKHVCKLNPMNAWPKYSGPKVIIGSAKELQDNYMKTKFFSLITTEGEKRFAAKAKDNIDIWSQQDSSTDVESFKQYIKTYRKKAPDIGIEAKGLPHILSICSPKEAFELGVEAGSNIYIKQVHLSEGKVDKFSYQVEFFNFGAQAARNKIAKDKEIDDNITVYANSCALSIILQNYEALKSQYQKSIDAKGCVPGTHYIGPTGFLAELDVFALYNSMPKLMENAGGAELLSKILNLAGDAARSVIKYSLESDLLHARSPWRDEVIKMLGNVNEAMVCHSDSIRLIGASANVTNQQENKLFSAYPFDCTSLSFPNENKEMMRLLIKLCMKSAPVQTIFAEIESVLGACNEKIAASNKSDELLNKDDALESSVLAAANKASVVELKEDSEVPVESFYSSSPADGTATQEADVTLLAQVSEAHQ